MNLNVNNAEKGCIKIENLRILYKNICLLLETDIRKLNEFIKEINNDIQEKNIKKKEIIDKAENSIQEYDSLFYEINSLKQALIPQCEKINEKVINNILKIGNPNDSIFLLMKTFYWITIGFDKEKSKNKNEIEWNFLQNNLSYKNFLLYLNFLSNSTMSYLTNEDLDESMPFLVNYDKLKNIFNQISEDLVIILDFIKSSLELNVKINIMNSLYENNCNKNTKKENIDISINNLNNLLQKGKMILSQIIKDYKNYKIMEIDDEKQIKKGYLILEKYSLFERYSVERERHKTIGDISTIKFIIKLNKKYRNKEKFIMHLSLSLNNFIKGKRKLNENKFISDIKNSKNKKELKGRNYEKKYELNSIKEENYSSSLNTQNNLYDGKSNNYSNNISEFENLTGRYSYNYNYDWYNNIENNGQGIFNDNLLEEINNIIPIQNKKYNLVIKGNKDNHHIRNNNSFPMSSLNKLLKEGNKCECEQTKCIDSSSKNKKILNLKRPFLIPKNKGKLTLEQEENDSYYSYFCFKNNKTFNFW